MCSYLLLKGDKGDTHPHFGFNLKKEPEMNFCFGSLDTDFSCTIMAGFIGIYYFKQKLGLVPRCGIFPPEVFRSPLPNLPNGI